MGGPESTPASGALAPGRRDQVVAQLGAAWAAEAIDEREMERRMAAVFAAREPAELERLVADLPASTANAAPAAHMPAPHHVATAMQAAQLRRVMLGSVEERVQGVVPAQLELGVRLGNLELDFTHAEFPREVTEIVLDVVLGNVELKLPGDLILEMRIGNVMSAVEFHEKRSMVPRSGRTVILRGSAVLGNVEVTAVGEG